MLPFDVMVGAAEGAVQGFIIGASFDISVLYNVGRALIGLK